jgi:hypothetical protein
LSGDSGSETNISGSGCALEGRYSAFIAVRRETAFGRCAGLKKQYPPADILKHCVVAEGDREANQEPVERQRPVSVRWVVVAMVAFFVWAIDV